MSTVDIQGAADLMKVHPKTVLNLIQTGALRAARIGRAYVMLERDVMSYIERQIVEQTAGRMGGGSCTTQALSVQLAASDYPPTSRHTDDRGGYTAPWMA